ncbi:MAG: rhomboid family intramembrane serine protease [Anaerolineae bacterium]|nr:rhomboid family intramembrane serine protease [Anaerolineae bacterium]
MSDQESQPTPENDTKRQGHPLTDIAEQARQQPQKKVKQTVNLRFPETVTKPRLTYILIGINIFIWSLQFFVPREIVVALFNGAFLDVDAVLNQRQIYRLFTAMFLHIEIYHILFNSMALYYIGQHVERFFGRRRFIIIYLLGGLAGSILSLYVGANGLGASGAVMAIWGAEVVFWYQHRQMFGAMATKRLRMTAIIIIFNFVVGFAANAQGTANIGNFAHLGGLIGGSILAWLIGPRFFAMRVKDPKPQQVPIRIVQANPLVLRVREILFYGAGLAAMLLLAIVFGT